MTEVKPPTVNFGYGPMVLSIERYASGLQAALVGTYTEPDEDGWIDPPETISVNLEVYGIVPEPGNVFIKDWSEHAGWTDLLEKAGLVNVVRKVLVGPFGSPAFEVRPLWLDGE